jgi:hypothetical protein
VEGERAAEAGYEDKTYVGYVDLKISMAVRGRPEVPGYPKDQMGQILRSPEPTGSVGTMVYRVAPEKDGATLYKLGTWDKAKSPVY